MSMDSKLELMHVIARLKTTKRTGWVRQGIKQPESIADHMYRMAMLALLSEQDESKLDIFRCVAIAVVHDLAEAEVGDITPKDGVSDEDKYKLESDAIDKFCTQMLPPDSKAGQRIKALWHEYEENTTPEARFVKDLDKLELGLQAVEYERDQGHDLQEFLDSTQHKIKTDEAKSWSQALMQERENLSAAASS